MSKFVNRTPEIQVELTFGLFNLVKMLPLGKFNVAKKEIFDGEPGGDEDLPQNFGLKRKRCLGDSVGYQY